MVGRGHWPVASPFPPSSPWGKTAAWLALQEVSGAPSACPLAFMAVLARARSATVLSLPRPAPALSTSFCGDHGGCSGSVPGDPVGFALELQLVFEKNKGRAPGLRADLFLGVLVSLMFSLRCTCSWAPPAGSSWPLTLRLSFLFLFTHMEPQCCDQSGQKCGRLQVCCTVGPFTPREERWTHCIRARPFAVIVFTCCSHEARPQFSSHIEDSQCPSGPEALSGLSGLCRSPSDQEQRHDSSPKGASVWSPC